MRLVRDKGKGLGYGIPRKGTSICKDTGRKVHTGFRKLGIVWNGWREREYGVGLVQSTG